MSIKQERRTLHHSHEFLPSAHTVRAPIFSGTILSQNTSMETIPLRCIMRMIFSCTLANCHLPLLMLCPSYGTQNPHPSALTIVSPAVSDTQFRSAPVTRMNQRAYKKAIAKLPAEISIQSLKVLRAMKHLENHWRCTQSLQAVTLLSNNTQAP